MAATKYTSIPALADAASQFVAAKQTSLQKGSEDACLLFMTKLLSYAQDAKDIETKFYWYYIVGQSGFAIWQRLGAKKGKTAKSMAESAIEQAMLLKPALTALYNGELSSSASAGGSGSGAGAGPSGGSSGSSGGGGGQASAPPPTSEPPPSFYSASPTTPTPSQFTIGTSFAGFAEDGGSSSTGATTGGRRTTAATSKTSNIYVPVPANQTAYPSLPDWYAVGGSGSGGSGGSGGGGGGGSGASAPAEVAYVPSADQYTNVLAQVDAEEAALSAREAEVLAQLNAIRARRAEVSAAAAAAANYEQERAAESQYQAELEAARERQRRLAIDRAENERLAQMAAAAEAARARGASMASAATAGSSSQTFSTPSGMRQVVVQMKMLDEFLRVAEPKTRAKTEFCGILAGVEYEGRLWVTTLILPDQRGSSDQVETTAEGDEALAMYQITHELLPIGWIHTHPTQTCFMSSVDLHTHCGFQSQLPEAVAIVMAPTFTPNHGIFHLTNPPGLELIQNCRETGFHQHPKHVTIYEHCQHVLVGQNPLKIVDLRGGGESERII